MRKLIVSEFVSLDGVVDDPGGSDKTRLGGWTRAYGDEEMGKFKYQELFSADGLLLGRTTYEGFAKAWPTMEGTGDFGERMNSMAKYVVSTTMTKADEWNNSTVLQGDLSEAVNKLKQQPGQDILVFGSANLIQSLIQRDLIDQYQLLVFPIVLGEGKRLFQDGSNAKLKLIESKSLPSGIVLVTYQPEKA